MIRVAIVEDQEDTQELLAAILEMDPTIELTGVFGDGTSAVKNIPQLNPDIVMMDIGLPDFTGIECIKKLKNLGVTSDFLVCSTFGDEAHVFSALEAGATSYLLKSSKPDVILQAVKELYQNGSPMSPEIARILINSFFRKPEPEPELQHEITEREYEILTQLSQGLLYKEIADRLGISINTLKVHCYNMYKKLHVKNRMEAINKVFGKDH